MFRDMFSLGFGGIFLFYDIFFVYLLLVAKVNQKSRPHNVLYYQTQVCFSSSYLTT